MSEDHYKAIDWCFKEGIKLYPVYSRKSKDYHIEINNRGEMIHSGIRYTKSEVDAKVWELYLHYYKINVLDASAK